MPIPINNDINQPVSLSVVEQPNEQAVDVKKVAIVVGVVLLTATIAYCAYRQYGAVDLSLKTEKLSGTDEPIISDFDQALDGITSDYLKASVKDFDYLKDSVKNSAGTFDQINKELGDAIKEIKDLNKYLEKKISDYVKNHKTPVEVTLEKVIMASKEVIGNARSVEEANVFKGIQDMMEEIYTKTQEIISPSSRRYGCTSNDAARSTMNTLASHFNTLKGTLENRDWGCFSKDKSAFCSSLANLIKALGEEAENLRHNLQIV